MRIEVILTLVHFVLDNDSQPRDP